MTISHSTLGAAALNDGEHISVKKKLQPMKFCVFSRGKTTENRSVSAQRSTWQGEKNLKIEGVNFLIFEKNFLEIYIKFACWWWFCCLSAKHFHIVLCVWFYNSELRHVRIFVTPCSFYVLLQCDGKARCFFWHKDAGSVTKLYRKRELRCVGWSKEQCSFATRDCCFTDRADLTVGPTLSSEKSGWVFWSIAPKYCPRSIGTVAVDSYQNC